jgi:hypothetical protein
MTTSSHHQPEVEGGGLSMAGLVMID